MTAYYNEFDPYAAQWLRNLIAAGHIAPGYVDDRSIKDVKAEDLKGFTQVHFFAGIGVWSHALRLAGWPDDRPVWTGSCPCQPFSAAGRREGINDERHLWPDFFRLIKAHKPITVFGEQVASKDGLAWLDIVHADLESAGYAVGAVDTCAAGFGAPHIRQRLYFVADAQRRPAERRGHDLDGTPGAVEGGAQEREWVRTEFRAGVATCELVDTDGRESRPEGLQRSGEYGLEPQDGGAGSCVMGVPASDRPEVRSPLHAGLRGEGLAEGCSTRVLLGDTNDARSQGRGLPHTDNGGVRGSERAAGQAGPVNGFWRDADWLPCIDGKARPVEPGTFPLAHGAPARVGRLRAYGNAINARQAAGFIEAYLSR